jgi:hypothetical protein
MSTCCKTINPLRRDGTSQKQRFPLQLAESYVQIDERSHADILNFTRALADEFNFYYANNAVQGTWVEFFREDLSFLLAHITNLGLAPYEAYFASGYADVEAAAPGPAKLPFLEILVQWFIAPLPPDNQDSIPALFSQWIALLPDSSLYDDGAPYSYRDLVSDARNRLGVILRKLQIAQAEIDARYGTTSVTTGWANLAASGWEAFAAPVELPTDTDDYTYLNSADPNDDLDKVLELEKACYETVMGMVASLQKAIPQYLRQSLAHFPWHNPQNALFLVFMRLFDHAKAHINTLGRKHLLYEYIDVLRFSQRPLIGDQAVVIFELRKGVEQYVLPVGTSLKAGKDVDGNPISYAVVAETAINQAAVRSLMSIHVERDGTTVQGVFASPIANSADGLGAPLPEKDPKWNMFGEAQLALLPGDRTMPDARLGFAVASPLFVMKEGKREISVTFEIDPATLPAIASHPSRARLEATILHALQVSYTHAKGWAPAKVASVFFVENQSTANALNLKHAVANAGQFLLDIKVLIEEGELPFVPYVEKVHQEGMGTLWPVLKLSFIGQSLDFASTVLALPHISAGNVAPNDFCLYGGHLYRNLTGNNQNAIVNFALQEDPTVFLKDIATPYDDLHNYVVAERAYFDGGIYEALVAIPQGTFETTNRNPESHPELWKRLGMTFVYDSLRKLLPRRLHLRVDASGISGVLLENDFGKLKAEKPFPMFGAAPVIGSRFYIGSQEIFGKQLNTLSIRLVWQDPPDHMGKHYSKYESILTAAQSANTNSGSTCGVDCMCCKPPVLDHIDDLEMEMQDTQYGKLAPNYWEADQKFDACYISCPEPTYALGNGKWEVDVALLYEGLWAPLPRRTLFHQEPNGAGAGMPHTIDYDHTPLDPYLRDLSLTEPVKLESNSPRGFLRLELVNPYIAFGHKYYRDLYVKETMNVAYDVAKQIAPTPDFPGEPYTPVVKEIKLTYSSIATIDFGPDAGISEVYDTRVDQFFHLHPFGHTEEHAFIRPDNSIALVPQYPEEGYLYLGIEGLVAPSTLSVLFQLAEGSADPDLEGSTPVWSILVDNQWRDLRRRDILFDSTDELISTGVIRYDFDSDFNKGNTLLHKDLHWVRVKVQDQSPAYMKAVEIVAQAVVVQFQDQKNNPAHLAKALPSRTINGLTISDSSVKSVVQPYGSFGGRMPEEAEAFLTRVSERLRHKQRAINVWDYERMVLEEFPSIYKVKCLNHSEYKAPHTNDRDWEISPGFVTVVCIPDLRNLNGVNPFEPKTSVRILKKVHTFLDRHVSSWVDLKVVNPLYEQIAITCMIGFVEGKDPGYYTQQLEIAIQQFLSPWAFDHEREIVFGGRMHRSHIIRFIEQQDYVDFVVNFRMDHHTADGILEDVLEAAATTGRSILVSATGHAISSVKPDCALCIPTDNSGTVVTGCCGE